VDSKEDIFCIHVAAAEHSAILHFAALWLGILGTDAVFVLEPDYAYSCCFWLHIWACCLCCTPSCFIHGTQVSRNYSSFQSTVQTARARVRAVASGRVWEYQRSSTDHWSDRLLGIWNTFRAADSSSTTKHHQNCPSHPPKAWDVH